MLPGLLGGPEFFKREYAIPIDRELNVEKTNALQKITGTVCTAPYQKAGSGRPARED